MGEKLDHKNEKTNQIKSVAQNVSKSSNSLQDNRGIIQKKANNTGLPDNLKSGIENLSGIDMSDTKVHYNSSKPAQLNAHAYAQGTEIHIASGQEKHLPHEAWHVVQQKQGRVKPTMQMKGKVNVNDDAGLEKEADVMGTKAVQSQSGKKESSLQFKEYNVEKIPKIQLKENTERPLQFQLDGLTGYAGTLQRRVSEPVLQMMRSSNGLQSTLYSGDQAIVTQLVLSELWETTKKYSTALLLGAEALTTITAGAVGCAVNPGVGLLAILHIGLPKLGRALIAYSDARYGASAESKHVADKLRGIEALATAGLALIAGVSDLTSVATKVTAIIFAIVKALRAIIQLAQLDQYKIGSYVVQAMQAIEGVVVFIGGVVHAPSTATTVAASIVGPSKITRSGIGTKKTYDKFNPLEQ